jgi:hypothetical protein
MTRHDIYRRAVEKFQKEHPEFQAREVIASRLGMSYKGFSSILEGVAQLSTEREDHLVAITGFDVYADLSRLTFPKKQRAS